MFPNIVIFGKEITWYSIMWLIGVFFVLGFSFYKSHKEKIDENETLTILLVSAIGVVFGGHILYGITNLDAVFKVLSDISIIGSFSDFIDISTYIFGGSVFYGGLFGGIYVAYCYLKKKNHDVIYYSDLLTPVIPLFHFFGRIGCFLTGCCFGVESKIGICYHHAELSGAGGVVRFPIQLVEALGNLTLFLVLFTLQNKSKAKGKLLSIYLASYAIMRFILEFFRGDEIRGVYFGISTSQIISIIILVTLFILFIKNKLKSKA